MVEPKGVDTSAILDKIKDVKNSLNGNEGIQPFQSDRMLRMVYRVLRHSGPLFVALGSPNSRLSFLSENGLTLHGSSRVPLLIEHNRNKQVLKWIESNSELALQAKFA